MRTNARASTYKGIHFDSQFEIEIYQTLENLNINKAFIIHRPYPVIIKPRTNAFPAIKWKIDFALEKVDSGKILLLEGKGLYGNDFVRTVKFFQYFNPDLFDSLFFCFTKGSDLSKAFSKFKRPCIYLKQLNQVVYDFFMEKTAV